MAERPTPPWTEEDELEYQIGDMNGIAFIDESEPEEKTPEKDSQSGSEKSEVNTTK